MGVHLSQPRPAEPTDRRRSGSSEAHESSVFVPRVSGTTIRSSCCLALVGHLCVDAIRAPQRRLYGHQIGGTNVGSGSGGAGHAERSFRSDLRESASIERVAAFVARRFGLNNNGLKTPLVGLIVGRTRPATNRVSLEKAKPLTQPVIGRNGSFQTFIDT